MSTPPEPTFARLVDWVEKRLSPAEAQQVAEQVAVASAAVQAQVAWLRAIGQASQTIKLVKPPPAVRSALVERFNQVTQDKEQPGFFQRLLARLIFDSALQPAAAGARAAELGRTRQLVYATDVADVALNLQPHGVEQHLDLFGQILGNDATVAPEEFSIQLLDETGEVGITLADDVGEFAFAGVKPGRYQLILSTATLAIQLPTLELLR